ncbi:MAG TPA: alpha-glucan family phosphorylase [Bacteroidota bacterium]|nr:alpha-glucan family phosphorylase [Bacteroidota bacterium]
MTRPIFTYSIAPSLPQPLQRLYALAYNLVWVWDHELLELFMRLDTDLWEASHHNPVLMLGAIKQARLNTLSRDEAFLGELDRAWDRYSQYLDMSATWYQKKHGKEKPTVAYFSAEFGLTECLPNYSGGLGILSGDHVKSSSDLGVPLIGVGLLYQQGYFSQYLSADGWQQERHPENDFYTLPIQIERDKDDKPVTVSVELPGRNVVAQLWRVQVGRIPVILLDTNIPVNSQEDQDITDQLYGGDRELRIKQELMLGVGGYRALCAIGMRPTVCHMNEGHSAFLSLELCRQLMAENNISFAEAREAATAGTVFTTHTPVPAGNDYFSPQLMDKYFGDFIKKCGLTRKEFLALGRRNAADENEDFCMTILALRMSAYSNGVSRLHGEVSRAMWQNVWPGIPLSDTPIGSITNGVHAPSWVSRDMAGLFERYLGPRWREDMNENALWSFVHRIPDEELWRTHERRRERLVAFARERLRVQLESRGALRTEVAQGAEVLNSDALTIGFARRYATYKRATLLLRNPERLIKILNNKERPVQIIFAGKAHPMDNPGKELIRQILHFARQPEVRHRIVFIEDYDMVVARYLVQGVDVWLNTPRRPLEASGTSGMKAAVNGALNLSVLDGWWVEAYNANTGWAIGRGEEYGDENYQDEVESNALYNLLEKELVPLFYNRGGDGLPRAWISKMKTSMREICPVFNTNRMVRQYTEEYYLSAHAHYQSLTADKLKGAKSVAAWRSKLQTGWQAVKLIAIRSDGQKGMKVGESLEVRATVELGKLVPADVSVELYHGPLDADGEIINPQVVRMGSAGGPKGTTYEFIGTIKSESSGRHGYTIRILPQHPEIENPSRQGLVLWG